MKSRAQGMTLLEVLLALLALGLGLFASAALQVRAQQATEGARRDTQAVHLAQGLLEQARAAGRLQAGDLANWRAQLARQLGASAEGRAVRQGELLALEVRWRDPREAGWQVIHLHGKVAP
ncbi:prepilin-type N-terminal cleavage/methylation domain-containing protein [Pseudomonas entomophila]|uniref:prepilin-type N-terminal cleavage/methylation domain-containing protein n=1 Tax=Pseudomonas entomophila TaxID=312306 RepID=UPI0023D824E7|nr:prepilin-type N-terminal cleavage/methylation domain-containing protein [Pseudomonas entomophila]MDF0729161.1 prepilin-type N-terminal cleavage/methylation domain-containing protein [Pseudomonas entomophila]